MIQRWIPHAATVLCLGCLMMESPAHAGAPPSGGGSPGGASFGQLTFYQDELSGCRSTPIFPTDCTGARFTSDQRQTFQPLRDVQIQLSAYHPIYGYPVYLVEGSTDSSGHFVIIAPVDPAGGALYWATLTVTFRHKDGRFQVKDGDGVPISWSHPILMRGDHLIDHGEIQIGTPASPDLPANAYDGAWMGWEYTFKQSALLFQDFTDVEIWTPNTICQTSGSGATSCANWSQKRVYLHPSHAFDPGVGVHELGHIASGQAHQPGYGRYSNYCYPCANCSDPDCEERNSWSNKTPEWGSSQMEEAVADHFWHATLYEPSAPDPRHCAGSPCSVRLEINNVTPCPGEEARYPLEVMRFLWDKYDANNENGDTGTDPIWHVVSALKNFPPTSSNGGMNEASSQDPDGRSVVDFNVNSDVDRFVTLWNHCGGVGD